MRRRVLALLLLVCVGVLPAMAARRRGAKLYPDKETTADMSGMSRIFLGWIDLKEDAWALYGYSSKEEWTSMIAGLNIQFLGLCQAKLPGGKTVVGATDKGDENAAGYNLYIKISDVLVDKSHYHLYMSIHFIDPRTNVEIGSIPPRPYFGNDWGLVSYLKSALDEASQKIKIEVIGLPSKKKGK
jgi:hypothetical protein